MKRLVTVITFIGLIGTPALAADMAVKAPLPAPPPAWSWTGFYAGVHVGGAWTSENLTETTAFVPPITGNAHVYDSGILGGGHIGYNWQFNQFVLGAEGDFEATSVNSNSTCLIQDAGAGNVTPGACFPASYTFGAQIPWQASARARLGATWGSFLFYVTGGAAFAEIKQSFTTFAVATQSFSDTQTGWTVGGGLDYSLGAGWYGRLEYRYADFGTISNAVTTGGAFWNGYTEHQHITENSFRIGLGYLFSGPLATM